MWSAGIAYWVHGLLPDQMSSLSVAQYLEMIAWIQDQQNG